MRRLSTRFRLPTLELQRAIGALGVKDDADVTSGRSLGVQGDARVTTERIRNQWENVQSSLWFIPAVLGVIAIALSYIMPEIDSRVEDELTRHTDWLFYGTADSARAILSAISGSLITVITLLFSITMLTLQQAATQYTPRIIRMFMNDRGVQTVLGTFLATFLYSLLVLRQVRGEDAIGGSSIPMLSVSLAILLTIVCLALLIYFIHHSATMFQAATIVERIHHEMLDSINRLYPEAIGAPSDDDPTLDQFRDRNGSQPSVLVRADRSGYLRRIDDGAIINSVGAGGWGVVFPKIGAYITHQQPLVEFGGRSVATTVASSSYATPSFSTRSAHYLRTTCLASVSWSISR